MESRTSEILFTVIYGLCFSWMGEQMLKDILPLGIGNLLSDGFRQFTVRALIAGITFILAAFAFLISVKWCAKIEDGTMFLNLINIIIVILLGTTPWLCYHISRIIMKPFSGTLYSWNGFWNVDVLYLLFYSVIMMLILGIRAIVN